MDISTLSGGRGQLPAPAAASIARIDRAIGRLLPITEAGRTREKQMHYYTNWVNRVPGFNRALHPEDPLANHVMVSGRRGAIDTEAAKQGAVTIAFMNAHGWYQDAADEYWHFSYFQEKDQFINEIGDVMAEAAEILSEVQRTAVIIGGTYDRAKNGESLSQRVDKIENKVDTVIKKIDRLAMIVGSTEARAKAGDTIGTRLDKLVKR